MKFSLLLIFAVFVLFPAVYLSGVRKPVAANTAAERKLRHIEMNGSVAHPDPTPTELSEEEVNAYLASGHVEMPPGVQSIRLQSEPGVVMGNAQVDFEKIKSGAVSFNPLLEIFSGTHDVAVVAHAYGQRGQGFVHVDSVSIDGVNVPRFALQMFVEKYLHPKYPQIGIDSQFPLADRIDSAIVGLHKVTIIQK